MCVYSMTLYNIVQYEMKYFELDINLAYYNLWIVQL